MSRKNVLYISYDGMTDPLGQSQVLPYLSGIGKQMNCRFYLISCEKADRFEKNRETIKTICAHNGIEWFPLTYHKTPPILSTVFDLWKVKRLASKLHRQFRFDAVHCRAHMPGIIGLYLNKKYGIPIINDIRGFWADEKVDAGAWNRANPIYNAVYKYFKKVERQLLLRSAQQICLTYGARTEIARWPFSKHLDNITVIPCCVDMELFSPATIDENAKLQVRTELAVGHKDILITYLGSIGSWYMLDEMLDFFVSFRQRVPQAKFLFVTFDAHDRIRSLASDKGIGPDSIIIKGAQRAEVPTLLSVSDVSIFFIRPCYSKISSSPTKQGEIMAMGIPVICNRGIGDSDMIVEKYHSGVLVGDFSEKAYTNAIEAYLAFNGDTTQIRSGALAYFSLEDGVGKYVELYKKVLKINES